jgi:hypothetical protein
MPKKGEKIDISEKEWGKIKTEYITTEISYRKLADKYGMTYTRLQTKAREGKWKEEREAYREKLVEKSVDLICDEQAHRIARAISIGDTMLEKVEESLREIDIVLCRNTTTIKGMERDDDGTVKEVTTSTEDYTKKQVAIDRAGLKQLSSILKDLKEIGIFRSELDRREQEARIDKLRKDAEEESKDATIKVVFEGDMDEYFD